MRTLRKSGKHSTLRRRSAQAASAAPRPRVIGLTGGIASGKSTIAAMFAQLGAEVIGADEIAHEVLASRDVCEKLRANWGETVFGNDGLPDREKIAAIVFEEPEKLQELNRWVHPPTRREMKARLDRAVGTDAAPLIVIDAPLLVEADLDTWCDAILFVDAGRSERATRATLDRGWDMKEMEKREAFQKSLVAKRRSANVILDNNGLKDETFSQVKRLFRQWTQSPFLQPTGSGGKEHG